MIFRSSCSQSELGPISPATMVLNKLFQCGVCANSCTSVIPLLHYHQALIEKLYDVLKIYVFPYDFPKIACRSCLEKIEVFDSLVSELLKGQVHFYAYKESMLHDIDTTGKKKSTETQHSLNCNCEICTEKCGLQLLADAIERKESEEMNDPDKSTRASSPLLATSPEPSTSTAKPVSSVSCKTKQLKCVYCAKMFSHRGDMNKHLRTHTGEEPYSCHICHRKFKHTSNLKRHLTVHSGDKPFQCNLCGKKFNRKDKMESHRKTRLCKKNTSQ